MPNKTILIILVVLLLFGLCFLTALVAGVGTWLFATRARVSNTEVYATVFPEATPTVGEESLPETISPATLPAPTDTPPPPQVTVEATPNVDFNGIRFYLDLQLAQGVLPELVPAALGNAAEVVPGEVHPEYTQFTLQGYVLRDTFHAPRLFAYPLNEYRAMDRLAGENADLLLRLLQTKPSTLEELPFLPIWPAASLIQAKVSYLDFKHGSGIRYLTQFAQDVSPIHNSALIYTYQGISNDQLWYVAAVLPVSHPSLPANLDEAGFEVPNPETYYQQIEAQLSAKADETFVPSLALLDALIASLRVW